MSLIGEGRREPICISTSKELLDPEVGAVKIGSLEPGRFEDTYAKMIEVAAEREIERVSMVVDFLYSEGRAAEIGAEGQLYPISEFDWDSIAADVSWFCEGIAPSVYAIDAAKCIVLT